MPYDVFISYSNKDKTVADAVVAKLELLRIRCWIAPRDVPLGEPWEDAIVDGIDACNTMVLVFSAEANASKQVRDEVSYAFNQDRIVIPFRVEDVQPTGRMSFRFGVAPLARRATPPLEQHLDTLSARSEHCWVQAVNLTLRFDCNPERPRCAGRRAWHTPDLNVAAARPPASYAVSPTPAVARSPGQAPGGPAASGSRPPSGATLGDSWVHPKTGIPARLRPRGANSRWATAISRTTRRTEYT